MHSRFFNDLPISQYRHTCKQMYQDSRRNLLHMHNILFSFLHSHWHLSVFHFCLNLHFLPPNSSLNLNKICFASFFNSFIPLIILNAEIFKLQTTFQAKMVSRWRFFWITNSSDHRKV